MQMKHVTIISSLSCARVCKQCAEHARRENRYQQSPQSCGRSQQLKILANSLDPSLDPNAADCFCSSSSQNDYTLRCRWSVEAAEMHTSDQRPSASASGSQLETFKVVVMQAMCTHAHVCATSHVRLTEAHVPQLRNIQRQAHATLTRSVLTQRAPCSCTGRGDVFVADVPTLAAHAQSQVCVQLYAPVS